jgi:eukaryotic-like serine/threonine-protein kinase
MTGYLEFLNRG